MRPFKSFLTTLVSFALILLSTTAFGQSGCTTASACNYDPAAVTDDGSCCNLTCVTVEVIPNYPPNGPLAQWEIRDSQGSILADGASGVFELCLNDPCFSFHMFDFNYGYSSVAAYTIEVNNIEVLTGDFPLGMHNSVAVPNASCGLTFGCTLPFACNYDPLATALDWTCQFPGCKDPLALNYNPDAGCDDGSCTNFSFCGGGLASDPDGRILDFPRYLNALYWSSVTEGNGSIVRDPFHVLLTASDGSSASGSLLTESTTEAKHSGTYSFSWDYHSNDTGAQYEIGYYINGVRTNFTDVFGSLDQSGTVSFFANAGDDIGFGIESTDDIGGPAYLLISDFKSPSSCGCINPEACNYSSTAYVFDGMLEDCVWDCYGCTDITACNYEGGIDVDSFTILDVYAEMFNNYPWLTTEEILTYIDDNIFLAPCVYGLGAAFTCDCYDPLTNSEAWVQAIQAQDYTRETPFVCDGYQMYGMHGGYQFTDIELHYDCSGLPATFDAHANAYVIMDLYLPANVPSIRLTGDCNSTATINIHRSASTVVTGSNGAIVNEIVEEIECGCTDSAACNFSPTASDDDGSCCFENCVSVLFNPDFYGLSDNSRWELRNTEGNVLHSGQGFGGITEYCVSDACMTFHVFDDFGDGWGDGSYAVTVNGFEALNGTFPTGFYDSFPVISPSCSSTFGCTLPFACNYDPAADVLDGCLFEGCMDPSALNYNPEAGCDDGSCTTYTSCDGRLATTPGGDLMDFSYDLQPFIWNELSEGSGSITHDRFDLVLTASNNVNVGTSSLTQTTVQAARTGLYSFHWDYFSIDAGAQYEIGYYINGSRVDLTSPSGSLSQVGTTSFFANEGDIIGFGIESTDNFGGPAYLHISDFTSPIICGCLSAEACNYNPDAIDGALEACNYDCYGCNGDVSCNFSGGTTITNTTILTVEYGLQSGYYWLSAEEINAYIADNVFLVPCVYGLGVPNTCNCYGDLWASEAYVQAQLGNDYSLDTPLQCEGQQIFGMHGGSSGNLDFYYGCSELPAAFDAYPGFAMSINLYIPSNVPSIRISGFDIASNLNVINVYRSPGTVVTSEGWFTVNEFDTEIVCGCINDLACNYNPLATLNDDNCLLPDGCSLLTAINYSPSATCGTNCIFETPCGYADSPFGEATRKLGFVGDYQEVEWTSIVEGTIGALFFSNDLLLINGETAISPNPLWVSTTVPITVSGLLSFNYQQYATGSGDEFDTRVEYLEDGVWKTLVTGTGFSFQTGSKTLNVSAGSDFGLRVRNSVGAVQNSLTVSHFFHPINPTPCIPGCSNPLACNFDPNVTGDDGSCEFASCAGCTYPDADNYDPSAWVDDGSCFGFAVNDCPADLDGDGIIQTADLLIVLGAFGSACP